MGKLVAPNPAYLLFLLPHLLPISVSYGDPHIFFFRLEISCFIIRPFKLGTLSFIPAPSFLWQPVITAAFPKGWLVGGGAGVSWWKLTLWEGVWQKHG